jgi:hypothetical protein
MLSTVEAVSPESICRQAGLSLGRQVPSDNPIAMAVIVLTDGGIASLERHRSND